MHHLMHYDHRLGADRGQRSGEDVTKRTIMSCLGQFNENLTFPVHKMYIFKTHSWQRGCVFFRKIKPSYRSAMPQKGCASMITHGNPGDAASSIPGERIGESAFAYSPHETAVNCGLERDRLQERLDSLSCNPGDAASDIPGVSHRRIRIHEFSSRSHSKLWLGKGSYEKEILEKSSSIGHGGFLYGDRSRLRRIFGFRSDLLR